MRTHQRILCGCLLLLAVASAFEPFMIGKIPVRGNTALRADVDTEAAAEITCPQQSELGKSMELPETYTSCGKCGAAFALTPEIMGSKSGRRMSCSICDHTWFQSRDRLATVSEGFEMVEMPERDLQRVALNIKEGRHPKFFGDFKMYVGNISFQSSQEDIFELFETIGPVGDVSLVRGEDGRPRGFGFVTMRNKADGEKALEQLDGADMNGRKLSVRPSNS